MTSETCGHKIYSTIGLIYYVSVIVIYVLKSSDDAVFNGETAVMK